MRQKKIVLDAGMVWDAMAFGGLILCLWMLFILDQRLGWAMVGLVVALFGTMRSAIGGK